MRPASFHLEIRFSSYSFCRKSGNCFALCAKCCALKKICARNAKMTNRELKKLTRADLLEMLIVKCRENELLRAELEDARRQLAERPAETAPAANDRQVAALMQALRAAAEQYSESMKSLAEEAAL